MSKLSIQVEKQVVMALTSIILLGSGCEDRIDTRGNQSVGEGTPVDVTFRIGLADEADAYTLSGAPVTKASESTDGTQTFNYDLCPANGTKATASLKPDALYNLEIRQYNTAGTTCLNSSTNFSASSNAATGSLISTTLQTATHCQLVLVAWGKDNTTRLGTGTLSEAQKVSVSSSYMDALKPSEQDDMNKMPYILHLTDVNVSDDGRIYSQDGEAIDIRLHLKRLATRLTFNWTYNVTIPGSNYLLNQILLQSVPTEYKVVAKPDPTQNNTYPALLDQYTTIQRTGAAQSGSYSFWLPANVRGTNPAATSLLYRNKQNAPIGSTYIDFQAVNQSNTKQKLSYRVYLGSNDTYDFNLYGNTDYNYEMNFNHTLLPINDLRVTIIDPIPASENNSNLVPTANCFMVAPGSAFCFDPFAVRVNGNDVRNETLNGWAGSNGEGGIAYVKLLWQTRENGDLGEPSIGVVNSSIDHTNIVDIKRNDGGEVSVTAPLTDKGQGRIYCRVVPNTMGGNGLVAAYNVKNEIIWSWHLWVTDYNPTSAGNASVLEPAAKRKLKFTWNTTGQLPMMDRNLGAMAGYINETPPTDLDKSRTNGLQYQWGRKEPFTASYSAESIPSIPNISGDKPVKGMLNRFGPDGLSYVKEEYVTASTLRDAYKSPHKKANQVSASWWTNDSGRDNFWGGTANSTKTVYDPCPAGWKVAPNGSFNSFFISGTTASPYNAPNIDNSGTFDKDGGLLCYFTANGSGDRVYIRLTGYAPPNGGYQYIGQRLAYWMSGVASAFVVLLKNGTISEFKTNTASSRPDGNSIRCIQERE